MIDEDATFKKYGYRSAELGRWSKKPIIVICEKCKQARTCRNDCYRELCMSCAQIGKKHPNRKPISDDARLNHVRAAQFRPPHSDETRKRISKVLTGRPVSDETRQKISESEKGKKVSDKTIHKLSESHKGIPQSEETRQKRSASRQGIDYMDWDGYTDKSRPHITPVHACYHLNKWFHNCAGHHITPSIIIFIPVHIHRSVPHNMMTGSGMDKMNSIAIDFLFGTDCNTPQTKLSEF